MFAAGGGLRQFSANHHQQYNSSGGCNRHIWYTHNAAGELDPGWVFPKTRLGLALVLLRRAFFLTGMFWIVRGLVGSSFIPSPHWMWRLGSRPAPTANGARGFSDARCRQAL